MLLEYSLTQSILKGTLQPIVFFKNLRLFSLNTERVVLMCILQSHKTTPHTNQPTKLKVSYFGACTLPTPCYKSCSKLKVLSIDQMS